jgi:hypothetical protein
MPQNGIPSEMAVFFIDVLYELALFANIYIDINALYCRKNRFLFF